MKIPGNTFIVTGGASGLGLATCKRLINLGAQVVLLDFNDENGKAVTAELGPKCTFIQTDVTSTESITAAVEQAEKLHPDNIRGLINCAGVGGAILTLDRKKRPHDIGMFEHILRINTIGTFDVSRLTSAVMAKLPPLGKRIEGDGGIESGGGERGVIINVASLAAFEGQDGQAAYAAAKGGVVGMTLPMARDLGRHNIRVMTIAPGSFETPLMTAAAESVQQGIKKGIAFPQEFGQGQEFAHLVTSIIENTYLNGTTIRIDAGARLAKL